MEENKYAELVENIRSYTKKSVKQKRFEHSVRVAVLAREMCGMYGVSPEKGYIAGLAHDMCKDMDDSSLLALASKDGQPVSDVEKSKPSLLHGRAASVMLSEDFGISDKDIIQAVARHTLGGSSLCPLAKIIYSADKIEPGRPQSTDEYRRALLEKSLNALTLSVLEENIRYLEENNKTVAPVSLRFRESLKRDMAREARIALNMDGGN